ncbi:MAG: hypothetical protein ABW128_07985 [Rhizorhabdus sp.]
MFQQRIKAEDSIKDATFGRDLPHARACMALVTAMIAEVAEASTAEQARGFFNAIGARLAALSPVAEVEDSDQLVERINRLWEAIGWGRVILEFDDHGLDIHHRELPLLVDGHDAALWLRAAPDILCGAYDTWLHSLGSGDQLSTRVLRTAGTTITLRHGL